MTNVRIYAAVGLIVYFIVLMKLVHRKKISIKNSIPWMALGGLMLIFDVFPLSLKFLADMIGVQIPLNAFLIISTLFIYIVLICFTASVSVLSIKVVTLTQEIALLEKRIREIEKNGVENEGTSRK